jgi:general secretion pathway protein L
MSKRLIGIEVGGSALRIAILNQEKGQISVASLQERDYADPAELTAHLEELLAGELGIGDQVVTRLTARTAYVRRLEFPFQDDKKIAAAIPFSLSAQLPVSVDHCATAIQRTQATDKGSAVVAAAVPTEKLQSLLSDFEAADVPLHLVDLSPFCYIAGLGEAVSDGLVVCATDQETTVSLVQKGLLVDYRVLPAMPAPTQTPELAEELRSHELEIEVLSLAIGGHLVDSAFLPAVALALRAKTTRSDQSFNFRSGQYALKGDWANLKRKLVLLAALLGMTVVILSGSLILNYADKAGRADQLQSEMVNVYRSLFPGATTIVDVPLQLKSAIRELQEKDSLLTGGQASALAVLKEISRLPDLATVEFQEFSLSNEELKLTGWTSSFEAVNQMASVLGESPMFTNVQVTDAKMSLDGNRIDFRLLLSLANPGAEQ